MSMATVRVVVAAVVVPLAVAISVPVVVPMVTVRVVVAAIMVLITIVVALMLMCRSKGRQAETHSQCERGLKKTLHKFSSSESPTVLKDNMEDAVGNANFSPQNKYI